MKICINSSISQEDLDVFLPGTQLSKTILPRFPTRPAGLPADYLVAL